MALGLNDAGKSITQPLEGVGPESLNFQGPPPSNAPRNGYMYASKFLRTAPYKQQEH